MKPYNLILSFALISLASCSSSTQSDEHSSAVRDSTSVRVRSQTIYSRGVEAGRRAMSFEPESREREAELLRAHAIATALEDSGYQMSAADYRAGVLSVVDAE